MSTLKLSRQTWPFDFFLQPQSQQIPLQAISLQYLRKLVIWGQMNICLDSQVNYFLLWVSAEALLCFYRSLCDQTARM